MPFWFLYLLLCMYQRFFCGYCDSQHCILVYESQNSLLKLLNISFFVYSFIILLFFHLVLKLFYICEGLLSLCKSIIYVLTGLICFLLELHTYPSSLSTSSKASFESFFEISKESYNFSFVRLVVNNIILCVDTSSINHIIFS